MAEGESLMNKGVNKGFGMLGERLGQAGAEQLRKVVREARAHGGFKNWVQRRPGRVAALALFIGISFYAAWKLRQTSPAA